jgi:hypothetical protein
VNPGSIKIKNEEESIENMTSTVDMYALLYEKYVVRVDACSGLVIDRDGRTHQVFAPSDVTGLLRICSHPVADMPLSDFEIALEGLRVQIDSAVIATVTMLWLDARGGAAEPQFYDAYPVDQSVWAEDQNATNDIAVLVEPGTAI